MYITFSGLPHTVSEWESKGLSNQKIKPPYTANKSLSPKFVWMNNSRIRLEFKGSCLIQEDRENVVNLYIPYELNMWSQDLNAEFTLKNCLFENIRITKNADPNKYSYSGCGIGFDSHSRISLPNDWGKNVIFFEVDMSSSVLVNNKNKDILILGKVETNGLDNTTLTAEVEHSVNF